MLNCITKYYSEFWKDVWSDYYKMGTWSKQDKRLHSFSSLTENWTHDTPLSNCFERRQALVEIYTSLFSGRMRTIHGMMQKR